MKYLGFALGICVVVAVALFGATYPFVDNPSFSEGIAALPLVATHHVAEELERWDTRRHLGKGQAAIIHTLDGFNFNAVLMIIWGSLVLLALPQLSSFVGMFFVSAMGLGGDIGTQTQFVAIAFGAPIILIGSFFVGRWIGSRGGRRGLPAVFVVSVLGSVASHTFDFVVLPDETFTAIFGLPKTSAIFGLFVGGTAVLFLVPSLLGFWRGRKLRPWAYLRYLMRILPRETRDVLVGLAYDEAQRCAKERAHHASGPAQPAVALS